MELTSSSGKFVVRCTYAESQAARSAGFTWDSTRRVWETSCPRTAAILSSHADTETTEILSGVDPLPVHPELRYCDGVWEWHSTRQFQSRAKSNGFRYDKDRNVWFTSDASKATPLSGYATEEARKSLESEVAALESRREASRATSSDVFIPSNSGMDYMPFQKAGVEFASSVFESGRRGVLIADEMGLGKTVQALGIINRDPTIKNVLVVCPASLKTNWAIEATKWLTRKFHLAIMASKSGIPKHGTSKWTYVLPGQIGPYGFLIINYDILGKFFHDIQSRQWDLVIADECHMLKDSNAQRTKYLFGERGRGSQSHRYTSPPVPAKRAVLLTGTPIVNRPKELFSIISFCDPEAWPSYWQFATRYCGWSAGGKDDGATNLPELQGKLRQTIMVRRLKSEVLKDLPAKVRQVVEIPAGALQRYVDAEHSAQGEYEKTTETLRLAVERAKSSEDPEEFKAAVDRLREASSTAFEQVAIARHETALAKAPLVIDHIREMISDGGKVVVFAYHRDVIDMICSAFAPYVAFIHGGMPTGEIRQQMVELFQSKPQCQVFVGSVVAAAEGITLTAASRVVFAELDWRPGKLCQAEDRCHRIGQHDSVFVQHLVLEGSIDAYMAKTVIAKQRVIERAMDRGDENNLELLPVVDPPATTAFSFEAVKAEAADISDEQVDAVHAALAILAGSDSDYAAIQNQVGFNKIDAKLGHELATLPYLTPKQAVLGRSILSKYRNTQLPQHLRDTIWPKPPMVVTG